MSKKQEQAAPHLRGLKKLKRATVRAERRAAKKDPEEAPRQRVYRGYVT